MELSPIYGLQILGGQSFYSGQKGSLSGNMSGVIAPAMKFNDNWALLPSLQSNYEGTEQTLDIVGGQTLFQSQWDNRAALRGVYTPDGSDWRIKPTTSFKYEMLQETKDEQLGAGLFDYYQWDLGVDAEYVYRDPFNFHAGVDYFQTSFPNYTSLESQAATSFGGQSLARELVGDHVLDTQNALFTIGVDGPVYERLVLEGGAMVLYERFPKQHVVDSQGDLVTSLREDVQTTLMAGIKMPTELNSDLRILPSMDFAGTYVTSNQNNFDAAQTAYLPYYYNYGELRLNPSFKVLIGDPKTPVVWNVAGNFWYRHYPYRPTQDTNGAYQGGTSIHTDNWMFTTGLTYPMAPHFDLVFNFQYGQGTSNMHFEQFFTYNYTVSNYMFGFSWSY